MLSASFAKVHFFWQSRGSALPYLKKDDASLPRAGLHYCFSVDGLEDLFPQIAENSKNRKGVVNVRGAE